MDEDRARQGLVGGAGTSVMIERHYGTLIAGEAVALAGAGSGGNGTATYVVSGALVLGGTLVALPPLLIGLPPLVGPSVGRTEPWWPEKLGRLFLIGLAAPAVAHTLAIVVVALV